MYNVKRCTIAKRVWIKKIIILKYLLLLLWFSINYIFPKHEHNIWSVRLFYLISSRIGM